jgi:hypothetical protein
MAPYLKTALALIFVITLVLVSECGAQTDIPESSPLVVTTQATFGMVQTAKVSMACSCSYATPARSHCGGILFG